MSESFELNNNNNEEIKEGERVIEKEKKIISDLDYLSEDLPKKPLRQKSKNNTHLKFSEIDLDQFLKIKKITKEDTLIKPINSLQFISNSKSNLNLFNKNISLINRIERNNDKYLNIQLKKKPKRIYTDTFLDNYNYNVSNLVQPINHRKNLSVKKETDLITLGVENLKKKMTTLQKNKSVYYSKKMPKNKSYKFNYDKSNNSDDYFFSLFKDFSSQNKSLHHLDKKVYKVSHKVLEGEEDIDSSIKQNNSLYKKEEKNYEYDPKNNFLENIGIAQHNITNSNKEYEKQIKSHKKLSGIVKINKKEINKPKRHSVIGVIDNRLLQLFKMNDELNEKDENIKNQKESENNITNEEMKDNKK